MTEEVQTVELESKTESKAKRAKSVLNQAHQFQLNLMLQAHLERHDDGTCSYLDEWDDARVLESLRAIAPDATIHNVQGARKSIFGNIRAPKTPEEKVLESLEQQIDGLRFKLEAANEKIKELVDAHNDHQSRAASLIDNLQVRVRNLEFKANGATSGERQMMPGEAPLVDQKSGERLFNGCARVSNK